jgi:hypothetical protein
VVKKSMLFLSSFLSFNPNKLKTISMHLPY